MVIETFEIDVCRGTFAFQTATGETTMLPLPPGMLDLDTNIERVVVSPTLGTVLVGLPGGADATVELNNRSRSADDLRAGRPVVYLDQNHWSAIAAARFAHRQVPLEEACAAERLIELVEARKVLLPVSAGHLAETAPLYGQRRTALATTVLQLSRGWQMRHPLHVRAEEILAAVQGRPPTATYVFAPQADDFFSSRYTGSETAGDIPEPFATLAKTVPRILGIYDTVGDAKAVPDEEGAAEAAAARWAAHYAELAVKLHAAGEPAEMVRRVSHGNLLFDLGDDLLRVAGREDITPEEVINRLTTREDPVSHMPFLGQQRQLLYMRLRNKTQRWEANDLIDIMFLSCAAGYADIVVGERRTIGYLRQASAPPPNAGLATSLAEAVALLTKAPD